MSIVVRFSCVRVLYGSAAFYLLCCVHGQFLLLEYFPQTLAGIVRDATIMWTWTMYQTLAIDILSGLHHLYVHRVRNHGGHCRDYGPGFNVRSLLAYQPTWSDVKKKCRCRLQHC